MEVNDCYRFYNSNFFEEGYAWGNGGKIECDLPLYLQRRVSSIPLSEYKNNKQTKDLFFVTLHTDLLNSKLLDCFNNDSFFSIIEDCYKKKIQVIIDTSFEWFLEEDKVQLNDLFQKLEKYIDNRYVKILINSNKIDFIHERYHNLFVLSIPHAFYLIDFYNDFKFSFPYKKSKKYKFSTFVSGILKYFRIATISEIYYRKLDFFVTGHPITSIAMEDWVDGSLSGLSNYISNTKVSDYFLDNVDNILKLQLYFKGEKISNKSFFSMVKKQDHDIIYNLCNYNYDSYLFLGFESKDVKNFITEKSLRPVIMGLPFITLPYQNATRYGFESYDNIFDYDYENLDIDSRIGCVLDQFELLQKDPHLDLLVGDCLDIIEYNKQHLLKIGNINLLLEKVCNGSF